MSPDNVSQKPLYALSEREALGRELAHLREMTKLKQESKWWVLFSVPFFAMMACLGYVLRWVSSELGRRYQAWYLRFFLTTYFEMRGASGYWSRLEAPTEPTKPMLILGAQYHDFSPLFVYHL